MFARFVGVACSVIHGHLSTVSGWSRGMMCMCIGVSILDLFLSGGASGAWWLGFCITICVTEGFFPVVFETAKVSVLGWIVKGAGTATKFTPGIWGMGHMRWAEAEAEGGGKILLQRWRVSYGFQDSSLYVCFFLRRLFSET